MADMNLNQRIRGFLESALGRFSARDYKKAIEHLRKAESLDRDNPEILYNLGISYCKVNDYRTAIECFRRVLGLPFTFVDIITVNKLLSYSLILSGEIDEALSYIKNILKLIPTDTALMNMLGYCYDKKGMFGDAVEAYRFIIEIDGRNSNALNSLAYVMARSGGDMNEAMEYAREAMKSGENNPAYLDTIGYINLKKGNLEQAKKFLKKALSIRPDSAEIREHIAELLKIQG
jgi:tetratricopeptide (TPR) repeat protein